MTEIYPRLCKKESQWNENVHVDNKDETRIWEKEKNQNQLL